MKTKTQKGITLIALIITIIVMLILVGVSVSVALNTGLFKAAQGAAKNTEAHRINETAISNGTVTVGTTTDSIENIVNSYKGGTAGGGATEDDPIDISNIEEQYILTVDNVAYKIDATTTWGKLNENCNFEFTGSDTNIKVDGKKLYVYDANNWAIEARNFPYSYSFEDAEIVWFLFDDEEPVEYIYGDGISEGPTLEIPESAKSISCQKITGDYQGETIDLTYTGEKQYYVISIDGVEYKISNLTTWETFADACHVKEWGINSGRGMSCELGDARTIDNSYMYFGWYWEDTSSHFVNWECTLLIDWVNRLDDSIIGIYFGGNTSLIDGTQSGFEAYVATATAFTVTEL